MATRVISCMCFLHFAEGVLQAEKDFNKPKHSDELDVPNLQVIKLMQSFTSLELVTERFAWRHFYWSVLRVAAFEKRFETDPC